MPRPPKVSWTEQEWEQFGREVNRVKRMPQHQHRVYMGPVYLEAQKILPLDQQREKLWFSAHGKLVLEKIKPFMDADLMQDLPDISLSSPKTPAAAKPESPSHEIDYDKLANLVIAKMRAEIFEHTEIFLHLELDERFKDFKPNGGIPAHMLDRPKPNGHPAATPKHSKIRVTVFGLEEKHKNTSRFNYLNHVLDVRLWNGHDGHAAKTAADGCELSVIVGNNQDLTQTIIKEIKKSHTKFVFTQGGLSSVDAALQSFCAARGLRFTVPEHPSHQH